MTTNTHDASPPEDDDPGVLSDVGNPDTISIPLLGAATAHLAVELPSDDDDDDEGDVVDDSIELSFDSLVAGTLDAAAEATLVDDDAHAAGHSLDDGDAADGDEGRAAAADDAVRIDGAVLVDAVIVEEAAPLEGDAAAVTVSLVDDDGAARDDDEGDAVAGAPEDDTLEGETVEDAVIVEDPEIDEAPAVEADAEASTRPDGAIVRHNEDVSELTPAPQPAARAAHELERVATRPEPNPMASKRLDDLANAERETADLLTSDRLLDPQRLVRPEPEGPWRQLVYSLSGRRINLGLSKKAQARKELDQQIAAPLAGGARFVPVLSRKGGVGKTTITTLLGMALADARDDRVIAVDANPDRGTLSERIDRPSGKTVRDLVRGREQVHGYADISTIVTRDATRLDVLASETDPHVSEAFSDEDYRHVADIAAHYYSLVLTDTGTGIVHSVMGATLEAADQLVVVAGMSVDEARLASETLTWLETNGFEALVRGAIVVLNTARPGASVVRQGEVESHFRTRVREVVRVPYDPQIAAGSAIRFTELSPETRLAARTLAAKVIEGLRALQPAA